MVDATLLNRVAHWVLTASDATVNTATRINSIRHAIVLLQDQERRLLELAEREQEVQA